jgi:hypothetical protein
MKSRIILLFVLVLCASVAFAQTPNISFNDFKTPGTKMPQRVPDGYHNLNWPGVFYVVGYGIGLERRTNDTVGVIGLCGTHCPGTFSSKNSDGFNLLAAQFAAGWNDNTVTVMPMRDGAAIGVFVFNLTTTPMTVDFTKYWTGRVESVIFTPSAGAVVFYSVTTDTN